jgi:hypothetical protein
MPQKFTLPLSIQEISCSLTALIKELHYFPEL